MLFCGIFISILNHINDSLSWRIRQEKKKNNPKQFAASSAIAWRLCLTSSRAPSAAMVGEGSSDGAGYSGHSTAHRTISLHCNFSQADDGKRSPETAANSSKQAANKKTT